VKSTSGTGLAATAGSGSACRALIVWGAAISARGEELQNHTAAITAAETTHAHITPNALRIVYTFHETICGDAPVGAPGH
jgi:hypothetical protein